MKSAGGALVWQPKIMKFMFVMFCMCSLSAKTFTDIKEEEFPKHTHLDHVTLWFFFLSHYVLLCCSRSHLCTLASFDRTSSKKHQIPHEPHNSIHRGTVQLPLYRAFMETKSEKGRWWTLLLIKILSLMVTLNMRLRWPFSLMITPHYACVTSSQLSKGLHISLAVGFFPTYCCSK